MNDGALRFGPFVLDPAAGRLTRDGEEVPLQPLVWRLLIELSRAPGTLLSRDELVGRLWPGVRVTDDSLTQVVRRLRAAIGEDSVRVTPRRGYTFVAELDAQRSGVPSPPDAFFGRSDELAELRHRLDSGDRLVTVTGPGGIGKTRLARELVSQRPAPAWFVPLHGATSEDDVVRAVARALGAEGRATADTVALWLRRTPGVLVLDDLERAVPAAAATVGRWSEGPSQVLAISRVVLGVRGERVVRLDPLSTPEAVALLRDRADLDPDVGGVSELVNALDRIPLAIELAAPRCRLLSPAALLEALAHRLSSLRSAAPDREPRHHSLRAALDDSWELLSEADRLAWVELSVFEGAFGLEDAGAVLSDGGDPLDALQVLVDHSVVRALSGRFSMLPLLRAHAAERGDPDARSAAEARHGRWFARLRGSTLPALREPASGAAYRALEAALPELVAASRRAAARGDDVVAGSTALAAWRVLMRVGPASLAVELLSAVAGPEDVRRALGLALQLAGRKAESLAVRLDVRERAVGRREAAVAAIDVAMALASLPDRSDEARAYAEEARQELMALDDPYHLGLAHQQLNILASNAGDGATALEHLDAAIALFRRAGSEHGLATALSNRLVDLTRLGRVREAEATWREASALLARRGDRGNAARLRMNFAGLLADAGRFEDAAAASAEAARELRDVGWAYDEAMALTNRAAALVELGRADEAEPDAREALALGQQLGSTDTVAYALGCLASVARVQGLPTVARSRIDEALASGAGADLLLRAWLRVVHAEVALAEGRAEVALEALEQVEALRIGGFGKDPERMLRTRAAALLALGRTDEAALATAEADHVASLRS